MIQLLPDLAGWFGILAGLRVAATMEVIQILAGLRRAATMEVIQILAGIRRASTHEDDSDPGGYPPRLHHGRD